MFQLTPAEADSLRFQIGTSKPSRGGRRYLPLVFTEQGVAMLSSVLRSERAILVNVVIMRAFAKFRGMLAGHKELAKRYGAPEIVRGVRTPTESQSVSKTLESTWTMDAPAGIG